MIKHANLTFVIQEEHKGSQVNSHLVNIIPVIVKNFEKRLSNQMTSFFCQFLSKF